MKSCIIILIQIMFLFSSFTFSQLSMREMSLIREIGTLKEETNQNTPFIIDGNNINYADTLINREYPQPQLQTKISDKTLLHYYGYNILTTFPETIIWDNKPPSGEYILGAGDEVIIEVWGDTQLRAVHIIDQYGKINIDKIGQVNLSGLSYKDLQSKLISKFQNVYSSLQGPDVSAYLDISIGKLFI